MKHPETLPLHWRINWSFEQAHPYGDAYTVKGYYHDIKNHLQLHEHDFYEINIVTDGSGRHYIGDRNVPTNVGDVFIIPPKVRHGYSSDGELSIYHILLSNAFMAKYSEELSLLPGYAMLFEIEPILRSRTESVFYLTLKNKQWIKTQYFISMMQECMNKEYEGKYQQQAFTALEIISYFCEQMNSAKPILVKNSADTRTIDIIRSIEFIEKNFDKKIDFLSLANRHNLSYSTYLRLFKKLTGTTPIKYQQNCRIKNSVIMLSDTNETVLSIALACGFFDSAHYIREFVAVNGITPTAYRKKAELAQSAETKNI